MDRKLDSLDPRFKPLAMELIARCAESHLPVFIINTRRTAAEQAEMLRRGVSWVQHSLHEQGLAIDVAPYLQYQLHGSSKLNWDANDPAWLSIGTIAERLGCKWGGRWKVRDLGHIEYAVPTRTLDA